MTAPIAVAAIGGFHVGGRTVTVEGLPLREARLAAAAGPARPVDPNGTYRAGQMYVQYVRLAAPRAPHPLLLWHGGGMSGVTWEDTPDGRPGWQQQFLEAGHDVYVADAVERGRASWFPYPGVMPGEPILRSAEEIWDLFRLGPPEGWSADPALRRPFPGQAFPIAALDRVADQTVPRWAGNEPATIAAYEALLDRLGSSVVVAHSQGCAFALAAARGGIDRVRAVVLLEPSGAVPPETVALARAAAVPHLVVWGDFFERSATWTGFRASFDAYAAALRAAGGQVEVLDLPAAGIRGNSHLPMMDSNGDRVAGLVQEWLVRQGLAG
ncbi:MAG: esterase [Alphaproteobacteria bacterium]